MDASQKLIDFLKKEEGFRAKAYVDAWGKSIGYGHFIKPGEEHLLTVTLTKSEAEQILKNDLKNITTHVTNALRIKVPQSTFDLIVALGYNVGQGTATTSTFFGKLNAGLAVSGLEYYYKLYNKVRASKNAPAKTSPVLVARRNREWTTFVKSSGVSVGAVVSIIAVIAGVFFF